jgi:hypothetical protein
MPLITTMLFVLTFLLIPLGSGCAKVDSQAESQSLAPQRATLRDMERYLATSDWHERLKIQQADANGELVFSRIYRAFDVVRTGKVPRDDIQEVDDAWSELLQNPALTIIALKPILFESATKEEMASMSGMSNPPVDDDNRSAVFSILCRIATFETTTNALHALDDLSRNTNATVAQLAKENLSVALEENWRVKKLLYQKTHSGEVLDWFDENVLRKGLSRKDVNLYLGEGTETPDFTVQYRGKTGSGTTLLDLTFWDDYLMKWEFEEPKPTSAN